MLGMKMMLDYMGIDAEKLQQNVEQAIAHVKSIDERQQFIAKQNEKIMMNQVAILKKLEILGNDGEKLLEATTQH